MYAVGIASAQARADAEETALQERMGETDVLLPRKIVIRELTTERKALLESMACLKLKSGVQGHTAVGKKVYLANSIRKVRW